MAINPSIPTYATADLLRAAAAIDVDIKAQGPNGATSGKALVVSIAGEVSSTDPSSAQTAEAMGTITDEPWDGVTAGATVISLLKKIALNTTPAP